MVYLAGRQLEVPARKQDIAAAEGISADYVEQLLMKLKTAGLVTSHRGPKGGFTQTRPPHLVTVADVLEAAEGSLSLVPCAEDDCRRSAACVTRRVWQNATDTLRRLFSERTISDLAGEAKELQAATLHTYDI
jgi:Rrf2 family protein